MFTCQLTTDDLIRIAVERAGLTREDVGIIEAHRHNAALFHSDLLERTRKVRHRMWGAGELDVCGRYPCALHGKPPAVIFDRDGTLASVAFSRGYVTHRDCDDENRCRCKDWASFNAHLPFDPPVPVIAALLRSVRPGVTRIMTTGRTDNLRPKLMDWLAKHELPIDLLIMRRTGDQRPDSEVKTEMYRERIEPFFDVRYVVDDRPQVVDAWRALGLPVLAVTDPGIAPFHQR